MQDAVQLPQPAAQVLVACLAGAATTEPQSGLGTGPVFIRL